MNFAQAIDPERVLSMRARKESRPDRENPDRPPRVVAAVPVGMSRRQQILAAQRGVSLTKDELHQVVGGSGSSVAFWLSTLKAAGEVIATGERYHYRYTAAP